MVGFDRYHTVTYLNFLHLLKSFRNHSKLKSDQRNVPLDSSSALINESIVVLQDLLCLNEALKSVLKLRCFLLHFRQLDGNVGQKLSVRVLLNLLESLQSFLLELDRLFHVLLLAVNNSDLDVAVSNLLGLGAKGHFIELPSLT